MIFRIKRGAKSDKAAPGQVGGREKFTRDQYKGAWNSVSASEDDAKFAVSGYIDEQTYESTAIGTRDMLSQTVGIQADDVVLEVGAGVGRVGAALAPLCKEWIGVDVSSNMVRHITKRLARFNNVRAIESNGYDLSVIPDNSVNVVYSTVVFMHLDEWDRYSYVKEGFRILRPGGRMLVDNVDLTSEAGWKFFEDHCKIAPSERPARISKTSTPDELRTYFTRAGYQKIELRQWDLWLVMWGYKPA
jgi:cyclopropane fatty-acyl-phospholipid synthase-like methyltransferase